MLTETWLWSGISSTELFSDDYTVYRRDRHQTSSERGGGVLIAVRSNIESTMISLPESDCEDLFVLVRFANKTRVVGAFYTKPQSHFDIYSAHLERLESIYERYPEVELCVIGDYNLPSITWKGNDGEAIPPYQDAHTAEFVDSINFLGLSQRNLVQNGRGAVLDLVLANDRNVTVFGAGYSLVSADVHHPPLNVRWSVVACDRSYVSDSYWRYNFRATSYAILNDRLSALNWEALFGGLDIDDALNLFYDTICSLIDDLVPKTLISGKSYPF